MLARLRRWLCQCPALEPTIQNTELTGVVFGFTQFEVPAHLEPFVEPAPERPQRHLHAVPDPTE